MAPRERLEYDARFTMTLLRDLELATAEVLNGYLAGQMTCERLYQICYDLFVSAFPPSWSVIGAQ